MAKKKGDKIQKVSVEGAKVTIFYPTLKKGLSVDLSTFSDELYLAAAVHGVKQRLGDAVSGGGAAEKYEMAQRIVGAFEQNSWELKDRIVDVSIVVEAMARVKGITVDEVHEVIDELDEDAFKAKIKEWRENAKVKAKVAEIQAERAAKRAEESEDDEPTL